MKVSQVFCPLSCCYKVGHTSTTLQSTNPSKRIFVEYLLADVIELAALRLLSVSRPSSSLHTLFLAQWRMKTPNSSSLEPSTSSTVYDVSKCYPRPTRARIAVGPFAHFPYTIHL